SRHHNKNLAGHSRAALYALLLALSYVGMDWILPKLFRDTLGHGFYLATHLRQVADLGGAFLLTFILFFVNHTLWETYLEWKNTKKLKFSHLHAVALGLCLASWAYGEYRHGEIQGLIQEAERNRN